MKDTAAGRKEAFTFVQVSDTHMMRGPSRFPDVNPLAILNAAVTDIRANVPHASFDMVEPHMKA